MVHRLIMAAILVAGLSLVGGAFGADVTDPSMTEVLARLKALEEKNRVLEGKLKQAEAVGQRRMSADAAVDRAMAASESKMGTVITAPDPHCRPLKIGGYLDVSYQYNFTRPDTRNNNLRVFDRDSNGFTAHLMELNFERLPEKPGEAGFRVDLDYGTDPQLFASRVNSTLPADNIVDLQQAYISYIAPIGNGITIDAGKFVTWSGTEVIEASDNDNSSRSILFGYAIPFAHTGIRATYPVFKDKWTVGLGVVNGWDNIQDQNESKTAIFMSNWTPVKWFNWVVTGAVGNEQAVDERARLAASLAGPTLLNPDGGEFAGSDLDDATIPGVGASVTGKLWDPAESASPRVLVDTTMTFTPWEKWKFMINFDYGEEGGVPSFNGPRSRQWYGAAGYVKYQFLKNWYLAVRGEVFEDDAGTRTGADQTLWEVTATVDWKLSDPLHVRFEYRHDDSSNNVFADSKGVGNGGVNFASFPRSSTQDTFMMQWLYKF